VNKEKGYLLKLVLLVDLDSYTKFCICYDMLLIPLWYLLLQHYVEMFYM